MLLRKISPILILTLLVVSCAPEPPATVTSATFTPQPAATATQPEPTVTARVASSWKMEVVAENLEIPWSIVFTSPERMLVSERPGTIREINAGQLNPQPVYTFADIASRDEAGLMGMVASPDYATDHFIYACYSTSVGSSLINRVVRLLDEGGTISLDKVILDNIPSASNHAGCRLGFGPDGKLYVTTGDALQPQAAQDLHSLAGKILRLNPDGSIPEDNPFSGSAVYSYGHRNSQGIAWQPGSGRLYATEHGPSGFDGPGGGDEINLILPGANYGWPLVSHDEVLAGTESPLIQFTPAVAPAAALFYQSDVLPMFTGGFFFGALRGEGLAEVKISTQDPRKIESVEWIVSDVGRVREVVEGPDGYIYFSTSNQDGRGTVQANDDKIYRLVPVYD